MVLFFFVFRTYKHVGYESNHLVRKLFTSKFVIDLNIFYSYERGWRDNSDQHSIIFQS